MLCMAVVLAAGVGLGLHVLSRPVTGHTVAASEFKLPASQTKPALELPSSSIASAYFQLNLPPGYRVQAAHQTAAGLLYEQALVKPSASGSVIIEIALKALPAGGLSEDSSFALRQQQADHYRITSQVIAGDMVKIAADSQTTAIAAFWPHARYLATIGVSSGVSTPGTSDNSTEQAALQPLLAAWRWR